MKKASKSVKSEQQSDKPVHFLANVIADAIEENKSIDKWLDSGKWSSQPKEFVEHWLCKDVEKERNGRSDTQMAIDLATELQGMRRRNRIKLFIAEYWLENGNAPESLGVPLVAWFNFESVVDSIVKTLDGK